LTRCTSAATLADHREDLVITDTLANNDEETAAVATLAANYKEIVTTDSLATGDEEFDATTALAATKTYVNMELAEKSHSQEHPRQIQEDYRGGTHGES
jgi:hypothetical protein